MPTFADPLYTFDDPDVTFGGTSLTGTRPAFQGTAFQADAFPVAFVYSAQIGQTLPKLTQHATAKFGVRFAAIASALPHLTQAAAASVEAAAHVASLLGHLTQSAVARLKVRGSIGSHTVVFQDDTFQINAFQQGVTFGPALPALTQSVIAFFGHAEAGQITSTLPALSQASVARVKARAAAASALPHLVQAAEGVEGSGAVIVSNLPALQQSLVGAVQVPGAVIVSVLPALTQRVETTLALWDEWLVSTDEEWHVRAHV